MFIYCICTQYLVGAPFALIMASIGVAWRWSVCGTPEVVWKPRFLCQWPSAHLHFLVSCFTFSSWQYPIDSQWGPVSLLATQAHQHHGHLTNLWAGFQKTQWTNTSRWHCTPNHHRLWKLNTRFQATWAMSFPPFLQTLGPWFPNEIQNLLSSEKRTLDHWATVQFFFSLAQVRRVWWQL